MKWKKYGTLLHLTWTQPGVVSDTNNTRVSMEYSQGIRIIQMEYLCDNTSRFRH
jgi:hypothetical protein